MSRRAFEIAYAGPNPDDHSMDVQELAPALMAIGQLIREANAVLNGKKATVKVLVVSDFEHKCFNINFELIQTILEQIRTLLAHEDVKTAKEILEVLGLLGGGGYSLWWLLRHLKGRKVVERKEITDATGEGQVILRIEGDANVVTINQSVAKLYDEPKVREAVKLALAPLESKEIDRVQFRDAGKVVSETTDVDAADIVASCEAAKAETDEEVEEETVTPDVVTWLKVYSPVFDEKAEKWRFIYNGHHIYADITETNIFKEAIARGGVMIDDAFKVRMTITETLTNDGKTSTSYKITEVLEFRATPIQEQLSLLSEPVEQKAEDENDDEPEDGLKQV